MADDAMRKALEQASSAGATRAIESLPQQNVATAELGTGEASVPLNTPGYQPGYGGNWNPASAADLAPQPAPNVDATPAPTPQPTPELE